MIDHRLSDAAIDVIFADAAHYALGLVAGLGMSPSRAAWLAARRFRLPAPRVLVHLHADRSPAWDRGSLKRPTARPAPASTEETP